MAGIKIVSKALEAPIRQIAINAGVEGSIVVGKVLEKTGNFGFNAQTEEYCDMVAEGIMDPTKVVRIALQDAASVAALLITTEAMVAEAPKKDAGRYASNAWRRRHGRHGWHGLLRSVLPRPHRADRRSSPKSLKQMRNRRSKDLRFFYRTGATGGPAETMAASNA